MFLLFIMAFVCRYTGDYSVNCLTLLFICGFILIFIGFFGSARRDNDSGIFFPTPKSIGRAYSISIKGRDLFFVQIGLALIFGVIASAASVFMF